MKSRWLIFVLVLLGVFGFQDPSYAATANLLNSGGNGLIDIKIGEEGELTSSLKIFVMMTVLAVAPSFLIMFTCFTHVVIVLGLTRQALGTMTLPPNQVLMGLALFITIYLMNPVFSEINKVAYEPYEKGTLTFVEAVHKAEKPIKEFMIKNTYDRDLKTFLSLRNDPKPKKPEDVSIWAAVPAYSISQITKGLFTGLMIYTAFSVVDMIIGSILMFMGMMMLPPQMISLPLKILIFIFIGGFNQVIEVIFSSIKF